MEKWPTAQFIELIQESLSRFSAEPGTSILVDTRIALTADQAMLIEVQARDRLETIAW